MRPEDKLLKKLAYHFKNENNLREALTHRSAGGNHNERLEFLGDSVLNFVVAHQLYERFAHAKEGELSRLRASLVKKETLAEIGRDLNLGEYLYLGPGELKSGGFRRDSILADGVEALVGAIYLDGGFEASERTIVHLFRERLEGISLDRNLKDPKSALQEFLQSRRRPLPVYNVISVSGEPHQQSFQVQCCIEGMELCCLGEGTSRRRAEQDAATAALTHLKAQENA